MNSYTYTKIVTIYANAPINVMIVNEYLHLQHESTKKLTQT